MQKTPCHSSQCNSVLQNKLFFGTGTFWINLLKFAGFTSTWFRPSSSTFFAICTHWIKILLFFDFVNRSAVIADLSVILLGFEVLRFDWMGAWQFWSCVHQGKFRSSQTIGENIPKSFGCRNCFHFRDKITVPDSVTTRENTILRALVRLFGGLIAERLTPRIHTRSANRRVHPNETCLKNTIWK